MARMILFTLPAHCFYKSNSYLQIMFVPPLIFKSVSLRSNKSHLLKYIAPWTILITFCYCINASLSLSDIVTHTTRIHKENRDSLDVCWSYKIPSSYFYRNNFCKLFLLHCSCFWKCFYHFKCHAKSSKRPPLSWTESLPVIIRFDTPSVLGELKCALGHKCGYYLGATKMFFSLMAQFQKISRHRTGHCTSSIKRPVYLRISTLHR